MNKSNNKSGTNKKFTFGIIIAIFTVVFSIFFNNKDTPLDGVLQVHYIDVGQSDCILIKAPNGENMLIDASTNSAEDTVRSYLKAQNVSTIKYAIFTHPHEDHIGSADMVVNEFNIQNIIMPNATHTSKTYERLLEAIDNKNLTINTAKSGDKYSIGDVKFEILAPVENHYENLNDYSVVLRLDYGNTNFMFTGDAEKLSEKQMLSIFDKGKFESDVLKLGHHGSTTSTSSDFLSAVSPSIAIISCGEGNSYGHPHRETLALMKQKNINTYRTDEDKSILLISDGSKVTKKS